MAESWLNPTHWYRTNVVAQVALHDALRQKPFCRNTYMSPPQRCMAAPMVAGSKSTTTVPSTPYAVSRAACDLHLQSFHQAYGFPVVFTRAANVYGPGQQLYRIIPRSLSARTGKPMQLHGGGHSVRAFIHIQDVVRHLAAGHRRRTRQHMAPLDPGKLQHQAASGADLQPCWRKLQRIGPKRRGTPGKDQSYH